MAEVKNAFIKSKMNKDLDSRLIPNGEYRDAKNIQVSRSQGEDVGALENILGNAVTVNGDFATDASAPNIECIGYVVDESSSFIYLFFTDYTDPYAGDVSSYSTTAKNFIYAYNILTGERTKLLQGAFLNFSTNKPIIGVNLLENLLFWTDDRNQPRKINTSIAISNGISYYNSEDKISVAKYNPYQSIELLKPSTTTGVTIVTTTTTAGITDSNILPVNSAAGIVIGKGVTGTQVEANTYVTGVNGLNITVNKLQTILVEKLLNLQIQKQLCTMFLTNFYHPNPTLLLTPAVNNTATFNIDNVKGTIIAGLFVTGEGVVANTTVVSYNDTV
jgi:hypothetical protein